MTRESHEPPRRPIHAPSRVATHTERPLDRPRTPRDWRQVGREILIFLAVLIACLAVSAVLSLLQR